ncbi:MAG: aquaporin [Nitriliruptoraceae bacterium]|nr:aquaporin [Nitriliruptoraceae bacterium]
MTAPAREELRRVLAETVGTAFLLAAIVGSGIVTQTDGAASAQLFQHTIVVGLALTALILTFGPVSGAHFNPVVTLADAWFGGMPWSRVPGYVAGQIVGGVLGVAVTNATFARAALEVATNERGGLAVASGEVIATCGLLLVIFGLVRSGGGGPVVAGAVGAYIAAAIYFTSSASFANPAVTIARMLSDTYTGIAPVHVPGFFLGQALGLVLAVALVTVLFDPVPEEAAAVVVPQQTTPEP